MQERKDISLSISLNDFSCPITTQLFLDPRQVVPCGHLFENDAIRQWKEESDECPCCRKKIKHIYLAPPYFYRQFTELLEKNPHLHDERYFNLETFSNLLDEEKENSIAFKKIIQLLKNSDKHLNQVPDENILEGTSALTWLVGTDLGIKILKNDAELRAKISSNGLNRKELGDDNGATPLTWMVRDEKGMEILIKDANLRQKITAEGLNSVSQEKECIGQTPLAIFANNNIGIQLLMDDIQLRKKITKEGLNSYILEGENSGLSAVSLLAKSKLGIELLFHSSILTSLITEEGLNTPQQNGISATYELLKSEQGRKLLAEVGKLRKLISIDALHRMVTDGPDEGKSAAFWLKKQGKKLLSVDPELRKKLHDKKRKMLNPFFEKVKSKIFHSDMVEVKKLR